MQSSILAKAALASAALLSATAVQAQSHNFIGVGVGFIPVYEGSSEYRTVPTPIINYQSENFFVTPRAGLPALGLKTTLTKDVDAGIFVGMGLGRKDSKADRTRGIGDIDFHATYGAFIEWAPGPYSLGAAYSQAARSGYGGTLELRASYEALVKGPNRVRIGASTQWASHDAMQTWHGVTSAQSASSVEGLPVYTPSSGFKNVSLFTTWTYQLNSRWSTLSVLGVNRLIGDAADSPLTARKTNVFGSVGVIYAF